LECDLRHIGPAEVAVSNIHRRRLSSQPPCATGPVFEFLARGFFLRWWFFLRSRASASLCGMFEPADLRPSRALAVALHFERRKQVRAPTKSWRGSSRSGFWSIWSDMTPSSVGAALGRGLEGTWRLESIPAYGPALPAPSQLLRPI